MVSGLEFCLLKDWVGDGICDDTTNNKKCNYDGNDCCEGTYGVCYKCLCHLTKETHREESNLFANCSKFMIGDGHCDWWNDNELCQFDGGDCATTTTTTLAPEGIIRRTHSTKCPFFAKISKCHKKVLNNRESLFTY